MEWSVIASVFWKVCFGILLISLSALVGYICAALGSIRNSLDSIRNTLKSTEGLIDKEVTTLLRDVDETVKEVNKGLPELLENINGITASVQEISEAEIQPTVHSIQEMTETVNQNVAKLDGLVEEVADFSQKTVKRAGYYRDQLSIPITDVISVWSGLKAGWEVFSRSRKPKKSESGNNSEASNQGGTQDE